MALLDLQNVSVRYETDDGYVPAVEDVSLELREGEILGVVGESGSGKTTMAKSVNQLLPRSAQIDGEISFRGETISGLSEREMRALRWRQLAMIPQSAMNSLDPVKKIGAQFREVIRTHTDLSKAEADERTKEVLELVDLQEQVFYDYSHELSGGQRQRVVIALALVLDPPIVIADEPTTGLDVVVQKNLINLIADLQEQMDLSMLFITHDISVVAELADRVAVMYAGQLVEVGRTEEVFEQSQHPYTIGLRNSYPEVEFDPQQIISIPGDPPDLASAPSGCRFAPRCPFAQPECDEEPMMHYTSDGHGAKCHFIDESDEFRELGSHYDTWMEVDDQ